MTQDSAQRTPSRTRKPGSQTALRGQNVARVMETLMAEGPQTQAQIARQTHLSRATVSNIVRTMVEAGLVVTTPTTSSGRRAALVRLEGRGAVSVGIDFGRRHVRIVLASLAYEVIGERAISMPVGHRAEPAIAAASALLDELLAEHGVPRSAVLGVGAGIPGPIDRRAGTVVEASIAPEWAGFDLRTALELQLGLPVHVDNDANLGALAEVTWGPRASASTLAFLKLGSGIGCGLIIDGTLLHGHVGTAGEIGHTPVSSSGPPCRCGNRGCLELAASTSMMIEVLGRGREGTFTTADIVRDARAGDTATLRVLEDAGLAVGRAVAGVVNLINPQYVVIGGSLAELGEILLEPIRRGMLRYSAPRAGSATTLAVTSLGDRAEALGAAALVLRQPGVSEALVRPAAGAVK